MQRCALHGPPPAGVAIAGVDCHGVGGAFVPDVAAATAHRVADERRRVQVEDVGAIVPDVDGTPLGSEEREEREGKRS